MEPTPTAAAQTPAPGLIGEILRFAVIGVVNTGIDFLILNILIFATGIEKGPGLILLNAVSFTAAVINSYYLNKRWAFKDNSTGANARKFSIFLVVSLIGLAINTTVLTVVSTNIDPLFGMDQKLWTNVAKIMATGASLVWNFIGYKLVVFKR